MVSVDSSVFLVFMVNLYCGLNYLEGLQGLQDGDGCRRWVGAGREAHFDNFAVFVVKVVVHLGDDEGVVLHGCWVVASGLPVPG